MEAESEVLPPSRPRGWDHAVIAVRDLDAAAAAYEGLGFALTAKAMHPFGTANRLALLGNTYIELIAVADAAKVPEPTHRDFGFAAFVQRYLEDREGLAMMALRVEDAAAEAKRYADEGLTAFAPHAFGRMASLPGGREERVSFVASHALDPRLPDLALFGCQHETSEAVWAAGPTSHSNGAQDIRGAVVVDENPTDHHIFYATMLGLRDIRSSSAGLTLTMPRGTLDVLTPQAFDARYPSAGVVHGDTPALGALLLDGPPQTVPAEAACGVALVFEDPAS